MDLKRKIEKGEKLEMITKTPVELKRRMEASQFCYKALLGGFILGVITFLLFALVNIKN